MKLNEIQEMWEQDAPIDDTNLGEASTNVPKLHAKYLNLLSNAKLNMRNAESKYLKLRAKKFRYYRGEMSKQELEQESWEQWQGVKPLKNEMEEFLLGDEDLISSQDRFEYYKIMVGHLESIIKSINSRTWDIKSAIDWQKFTQGY